MNIKTKPRWKNIWLMLSVISVFAIALASCSPQQGTTAEPAMEEPAAEPTSAPEPTEAPAAEAERLRAAIVGDESTLNPYTYITGFPGWNILTMQYDTLFTLDLTGTPQPWLVADWELSEDGTVYTLTLRDDVSWNDGEPFTAEDVKFTFEYYAANKHGRWTRGIGGFSTAEVVGDHQVVITLEEPNPTYIQLAFGDVPIIPKHIWEDIEDPSEHVFDSVTNVATGPYILMEYEPDQFYRFEANTNYFAGTPTVGELVLVNFADTSGSLAAFRTNEVDMLFEPVPPEQIEILGGVEGVKIAQGPEFTTTLIMYDMEQAPFDNQQVRQALSLALNLEDMVDTVFLGAATPGSYGWIHPASSLFNSSVVTEYNPDKANAILDEQGYVDSDGDGVREFDGQPMSFELMAYSGNPIRLRLAELAKEMWQVVGFEVEVASLEPATLDERVWPSWDICNGRDYQMSMFGWSAPVQAIPSRVTSLLHSDCNVAPLNLSGFSSAAADELSEALAVETDPEIRVQLIRDLQEVIANELPFILLLYPDGIYAYWSPVYDNFAFIAGQGVVNKLSFLPSSARP